MGGVHDDVVSEDGVDSCQLCPIIVQGPKGVCDKVVAHA
eukprot:CAMPEP_0194769538 /NCGR_PEP_ID=MMETSP0323_2-20130528/43464_1 /TAXON_ID=2866 ORGANISM="Crypthecodinium cohnii, Strain Seligo" /NCGR_SAMPLE_ID=MMETSP0323_2 /ASSEMBLY_ACC=CAM_ASM_000346 /LENGTH=38 /DNA_ID= /DNA_START= /DNA_END= /DNA_ORIENTATION=